jgi:hypothetical protein
VLLLRLLPPLRHPPQKKPMSEKHPSQKKPNKSSTDGSEAETWLDAWSSSRAARSRSCEGNGGRRKMKGAFGTPEGSRGRRGDSRG